MLTQDYVLGYSSRPTGLLVGRMLTQDYVLGYSEPVFSKLAFSMRRFGQHWLKTNQRSVGIGTSPEGTAGVAQHAVLGVHSQPDQSRRDG